ncbi:MAG: hypothetical protein HZC36_06230 [Armatimonadetes bacterium]|nr:hypothetical protein [Armatimonadota bacterium]
MIAKPMLVLSLVVLLFVVGAILWPTCACGSPELSRQSACMSNLKQIAQGALMYSEDYDGTLPNRDRWMDQLQPYLASRTMPNGEEDRFAIFRCPQLKKDGEANRSVFGYAMNARLSDKKLASFKKPETTRLCYDSSNLAKNASDLVNSRPNPPRHRNSTKNVTAYLDGHAKAEAR